MASILWWLAALLLAASVACVYLIFRSFKLEDRADRALRAANARLDRRPDEGAEPFPLRAYWVTWDVEASAADVAAGPTSFPVVLLPSGDDAEALAQDVEGAVVDTLLLDGVPLRVLASDTRRASIALTCAIEPVSATAGAALSYDPTSLPPRVLAFLDGDGPGAVRALVLGFRAGPVRPPN